jgi:NADPH-dependent curcumin reductase
VPATTTRRVLPMVGGTVSEVVQSRHPGFETGDFVLGYGGWQSHHVARAGAAPGPFGPLKLDPKLAPISTALGVLGMPGMTAYVGLLDLGRPKPGETVVVSAAAGTIGSIVGQLARSRAAAPSALRARRPSAITWSRSSASTPASAIARRICSTRSGRRAPAASTSTSTTWAARCSRRLVSDHVDRVPAFLADMEDWPREGRLKYREDIVEGLDQAPRAFIGLLRGENLGKMLVKVGADPTRG